MKIKIIKDIPGYKAGEIVGVETKNLCIRKEKGEHDYFKYPYIFLIEEGFAEEIKDDIDIEAIRNEYRIEQSGVDGYNLHYVNYPLVKLDEAKFINSYRIVKAVIDQLNDGWKPNEEDECYYIQNWKDQASKKQFDLDFCRKHYKVSFLPYIKSSEIGWKVIELCEPELNVLFGVNQ